MKNVFIFGVFVLLNLLIIHPSVFSQTSRPDSVILKNRLKIEFLLDIGNVFPTNTFVRLQNTDLDGMAHYNAYTLRLAKQTTGDKLWQQLYGYPSYGFGIYSAFFTNTKKIGNPIAAYGYFNAPFFRLNRLSLNYELAFGYAFNWNHYDPVTNPTNIAISADVSVYIETGLSLKYPLGKRLSFGLGYGFTHYSNGKLKMPNYGLYTGAAKISLSYDLYDTPIQYLSQLKPDYVAHYEWVLSGFGGAQNLLYVGTNAGGQTINTKSFYFGVYGVSSTINKQINYKSKIGIGFTVESNGFQNSEIIVEGGNLNTLDVNFDRHLALSIFPSYELVIDKLSLVFEPGLYLYRKKSTNFTPVNYQRIGMKYHFLKNTFFGINLRAYYFHKADFIEWTIGHRLNW